jgi:hypothetical protein
MWLRDCVRFSIRELTINGSRLAFALEVARHIDASRSLEFLTSYGVAEQQAGTAIVVAAPVLAPIAFRRDGFHKVSAAAVLQQRGLSELRGRPVLVGFGPTEISDRLSTPLTGPWPASGVEIHAQILDNVLSGRSLRPLPLSASTVLLHRHDILHWLRDLYARVSGVESLGQESRCGLV